ncbi:MAG: hypothetical protein LKI34_06590 [Bifidobacterium tibiigranuli]|jgi:uncharacterized membrane protein YczE|uniref:YczE/YyaS/YitT family protein n=1 Tax=Bifidobacterium tibiigranuli TaxID=2172043 RepID=UPI0026EA012B|nr:hypothetical protein [Bifidobacterium tibiigranuli]MCI1673861.1 hypothetical protein [Bifidobacterium tibiigranuli]MCI1712110.1 hypothetical protein [Bifidobacterium tibiigranuli]MCI1833831.1 hypothetical protein [Bifidobacterium tibiigranuli]
MKKLLLLLSGNAIMAFGTAVCKFTGLGIDPFNAFCVAISNILNVPLGTVVVTCHGIIGIIIFICKRENIGLGTVIPMVVLGYLFQLFNWLIPQFLPTGLNLVLNVMLFIAGMLVMAFGTALYIECKMGMLPYDSVAFTLNDYFKRTPSLYRVILDSLVAVIALLLGGPINIGTIAFAVSVGPLIDFFHRHWLRRLAF